MRKVTLPYAPIAALFAVLLATGVIVGIRQPTATANAQAHDLRATVSVVGDGRVVVQPDIAIVALGVEATGQTLEAAQNDASVRMQAAIDTLVAQGISRDDIKTNRLWAGPVFDQRNPTTIQGYRAANSVQAKIRQIDRVGPIVDAVTAAGANRVEGISFAVDRQEEPKGQARGLAMQNARAKADQLASLAGLRVTGIKAIEESDPGAPTIRPQAVTARADASLAPPPIEPGTQEIRTLVSVTYIIE